MTSSQSIANELSQIMNACKGRVYFVTEEGDRLVADSMLSALVGISNLLNLAEEISLHVVCDEPEDCRQILAFMQKYKLGPFH